jgi:hypothetical protein
MPSKQLFKGAFEAVLKTTFKATLKAAFKAKPIFLTSNSQMKKVQIHN